MSSLDDVQDRYASHGFLVIGISNTSQFNVVTTSVDAYTVALLQTVRYAVESVGNSSHPLYGMIDTAKIGISGHSMGGGGAIRACDSVTYAYSRYIKSAIAMNPFGKCEGSAIDMPIFVFSCQKDSVVNPFMAGVSSSPEDIFYSYQTVPNATIKLFADFKDMDHNAVVDADLFLATSGNAELFFPSMVSWFKVYLAGDTAYQSYLDTTGSGYAGIKSRFGPKGHVPAYYYEK